MSSSTDVFVSPGDVMVLNCRVDALSQFAMMWIKDKTSYLAIGAGHKLTKDERFHFAALNTSDGMSLTLDDFGEPDVGRYECQIASAPPQSIFFNVMVRQEEKEEGDSNEIPVAEDEEAADDGGEPAAAAAESAADAVPAAAAAVLSKGSAFTVVASSLLVSLALLRNGL